MEPPPPDLAAELRDRYTLPEDVATAHAEQFVASLERSGLLDA
jgi:hypothetical protein